MDDKTEQLRDIMLSMTDDAELTERQSETHGSLKSDADVDERLAEVVRQMRDKLEFTTTFETDELVTIVRGFYGGETDATIARDLGDESQAKRVGRARIDLHLLRDRDSDAPFSMETLREALATDRSLGDVAEELGVSESTVRRYRRVVEARDEIRRVNDRYRDEFENILRDRELSDRMTRDVHEDGLEEAREGQETNTQL